MYVRTLYQINARNTHVAENLHFIIQSALPGVLTGENCIGVGTIFEAQYLRLSTTVLIIILSAHHFS